MKFNLWLLQQTFLIVSMICWRRIPNNELWDYCTVRGTVGLERCVAVESFWNAVFLNLKHQHAFLDLCLLILGRLAPCPLIMYCAALTGAGANMHTALTVIARSLCVCLYCKSLIEGCVLGACDVLLSVSGCLYVVVVAMETYSQSRGVCLPYWHLLDTDTYIDTQQYTVVIDREKER